jgi:hypothetical protein
VHHSIRRALTLANSTFFKHPPANFVQPLSCTTKPPTMEKLNETRYNIAAILIASLFCLLVVANADYSTGDGTAYIALMLIPLITAGFAFFGFFLLKKMVPKFAWIPTLIAVAFLLFIAFSAL